MLAVDSSTAHGSNVLERSPPVALLTEANAMNPTNIKLADA